MNSHTESAIWAARMDSLHGGTPHTGRYVEISYTPVLGYCLTIRPAYGAPFTCIAYPTPAELVRAIKES